MAHRVIEPSVLYVGTPAYLVATQNPDGTPNLAPASSHFSLGCALVLGLEESGQSLENVRRHSELTVNFPSSDQWVHVERLAGVTGKDPVPEAKAAQYTFEPRKFERAGLTPIASERVRVPRVAEAPLQIEARVRRIIESTDGVFAMVETEVLRVHAAEEITVPGTNHLNASAWHPLIYAYRTFFDRGPEVGWTRKNPLAAPPEEIARWEEAGGTWEVTAVGQDSATVELRRCDGGELADVVTLRGEKNLRWALVQQAITG